MRPVHKAEHKQEPPFTTERYTQLVAAINAYGEKEADNLVSKYGREMGDWDQKRYEVGSWHNGPLVFISVLDRDGEMKKEMPTIGKGLVFAVLAAGFVPFGFRPETEVSEPPEEQWTGRFMWYLVPLNGVEDLYDEKYGLIDEDNRFLRNNDGDSIIFEDPNDAQAVADATDDLRVRKVWE